MALDTTDDMGYAVMELKDPLISASASGSNIEIFVIKFAVNTGMPQWHRVFPWTGNTYINGAAAFGSALYFAGQANTNIDAYVLPANSIFAYVTKVTTNMMTGSCIEYTLPLKDSYFTTIGYTFTTSAATVTAEPTHPTFITAT